MSRESLVFITGIVVFLTAFSGFPKKWEEIILIVSGIVLMIVGFSLRRTAFLRSIDTGNGERASDAFVEQVTEDTPESVVEEESPKAI